MRHQLNATFVRQFYQEQLNYTSIKERRYRDFDIRQFAGDKDEILSIGRLLMKQSGCSEIIEGLIAKLEHEDIPDSHSLSCFSQNLIRTFSSYILKEPFTVFYFEKALALLRDFTLLIDTHREKIQQLLLNTLKPQPSDKLNNGEEQSICSDEITPVLTVLERFLDEVRTYYDQFNILYQYESKTINPAKVTSCLEQCLLRLLMHVETFLLNAETSKDYLEECCTQLSDKENQELYN